MKQSPCKTCGACCAFFCVSFPDNETNAVLKGVVPIEMTSRLNEFKSYMKGTNSHNPRCIALDGQVGFKVKCMIYKNRPSICRDFILSWKNGVGNLLCDRARAVFGLQPFTQY
ncbi:MAG: YkgJ family cysteine cluster protein [Deltaproteobacteria bacterium]|nr:YkgJ family cysteine cluster protein [Deltaproteobacteria bacterium]